MRFSPKTQLAPPGDQPTSSAETLEMDRRIGRFTPGRPSSTYRRRYAHVEGGSPRRKHLSLQILQVTPAYYFEVAEKRPCSLSFASAGAKVLVSRNLGT